MMDLFTKYSPLNQSIPGLQEDNTTIYDESSSSDDNEDEEDFLSQKNLFLDPVEEKITLVETYLSNTPNQVLFQDPFAQFLKTFEEGIDIFRSSVSPNAEKNFSTAAKKQGKWEWPCLSSMLKEMRKDKSWKHLLDWIYWKREFIS